MNILPPRSVRLVTLKTAVALWLATVSTGHTMTWYFGYDPPADKRDAIVSAMNEAVADYNANGYFDVNIKVIYDAGIPTAQSDYNGQVGFGGSISARVAHHEISHYLGTGTTNEWYGQFDSGGAWTGAAVQRYMSLFDGPGSLLRQSGQHYYPYGLNYDNEDSPQNRLREVKLVSAMRFDMGWYDANGNGIDDEWELWKTGGLLLSRDGDADGDGISNYDEWQTEGDPMRPAQVKTGHTYIIRARHSQRVLEVVGNSLDNAARIDQYDANGTPGQRWTADYQGGGYWRFINVGSGKVLETANVSTAAGATVQQYDWLNNDGQRWRLAPTSTLYSKVFNKAASNMVLDVIGGNDATGNAAYVQQYNDILGGMNQEWAFDEVTPGELPGGLKAEYKFDNNVRDNGGSSFHGTPTGGITYTAGRVDGLAATFDGTTGSVAIPASIETNFSVAFWMKTTAIGGTGQWYNGMGLVDGEVPGVQNDFGVALVGTKIGFGVGNPDSTLLSTSSVNDGNWHHVVATRNNISGALQIYLDGVLNASGTGVAGARSALVTMHLGSVSGTTGFYNGSLDEVRLYNTVLGQTEISRLASVGTSAVANYKFDGNAQDSSSHGNHGNPVNVTYVPGKVGTSAAQFNGTNSFVQIPASVDSDFTVAFWVKTTATAGTGQWWAGKSMVDADVPGVANDWGISLVGNKVGFGVGNAGDGTTILSTTPVNDGAWHYVTAVRTNYSGAMRLYLDGILQATGTGSTSLRDAPQGVRVGSTLFGGSYFAGAIDDLRIYNYALGNAQAVALASTLPAQWTANDVGNPGSDGYTGYSAANGGTFTVVGGGTDLGAASDQFQFVSTAASGDQTAITRIISTPSNLGGGLTVDSKAGLMYRNTVAANSAFAAVVYDQSVGLRFLYRDAAGTSGGQAGSSVPITAPFWLKLTRVGNTFTASYATTTGTPLAGDWLPLGTHDTALNAGALAGLAVTSHNATQAATAVFNSVAVFAATPGNSWREDNFGSPANAGNAADFADPDHDGINNLLERALGLSPTVGNPGSDQPQLGADGTSLSLSYNRSRSAIDLHYQVLWSTDLVNWSATDVTDTIISTTPTTEMHQAKVPFSTLKSAAGFLRLQVTP